MPIPDAREALQMLKEAAKNVCSTILWTRDQEKLISTTLVSVREMDEVFYAWIPKGLNPREFEDHLTATGQRECYFSVSLARANLFFKARFETGDAQGLKFQLPVTVYKVQRRGSFRLPIPLGTSITVEFPTLTTRGKVKAKVIDLSAGGLSFIWESDEPPPVKSGDVIKDMKFRAAGRDITATGEVRHVKKLPAHHRYKGLKIGVQFKELDKDAEQALARYVFEESRKYFTQIA